MLPTTKFVDTPEGQPSTAAADALREGLRKLDEQNAGRESNIDPAAWIDESNHMSAAITLAREPGSEHNPNVRAHLLAAKPYLDALIADMGQETFAEHYGAAVALLERHQL